MEARKGTKFKEVKKKLYNYKQRQKFAQSAGPVKYTDCPSTEG